MSKYTTEVRYICEERAGFKESQPASKIDEVISSSWDKIFTTKCPFFNESYRKALCSKILKHYYLREIGCETVGMWIYWMNTKLEEIMPYYNQLYKSAELEFSPFDDVNFTKTGNRNNEGSKNSDNTGTSKANGTNNTSNTDNYTTTKSGSVIVDGTMSTTDKNDGTSKTTVSTNKSIENENNNDSTTTITGKQTTTTNNTGYNLYSDTPQGVLSGVEDQTYLTNATKTTDNGSSDVNTNSTTKVGETSTGTTAESGDSTTIGTTKNEQTSSSTSKDTTTDSSTEKTTKDGTLENTTTQTGETTSKYKESTNGSEDYIETVKGKMSTTSYSKLLEEYRDTFINIDMQVIDEFSELFLLLW